MLLFVDTNKLKKNSLLLINLFFNLQTAKEYNHNTHNNILYYLIITSLLFHFVRKYAYIFIIFI